MGPAGDRPLFQTWPVPDGSGMEVAVLIDSKVASQAEPHAGEALRWC